MVDRPAIDMPTIEVKGLRELNDSFDQLPERFKVAVVKGLNAGVKIVYDAAVDNAPRSPTQEQLDATRKHGKTWLESNRKRVRARSAAKAAKLGRVSGHTRPSPGKLEQSIAFAVDASKLELAVFVADNSKAGRYAAVIHDGKGKSWENLGVGSLIKKAGSPGVDDKFIERARDANEAAVHALIQAELDKVQL